MSFVKQALRGQEDRLRRTALRLRSLVGHNDYTRFVIVGIARTGSTLLINALNKHPHALAFGELFREPEAIGWDIAPFSSAQSPGLLALYRSNPIRFLETRVFTRWPASYGAVGFKLFYYHARQPPFLEVWNYLRRAKVHVLHIKRRNMLEQYLSLQLAHKTNVWSTSRSLDSEPDPIRLEVEACRRHFLDVERWERDSDNFFAGNPIRQVYYEDLAGNVEREVQEIERFLSLPHTTPVRPTLHRQRRSPPSRMIANYQELSEAFAGTRWAPFFTERPADRS